jgi:glutamate synthase domain-containing protein 1
MYNLDEVIPYGEKDTAGCGLIGFIRQDGTKVGGSDIIKGIEHLKERGNGLGGGFAVYGLYDKFADKYAFHVMYDDNCSRERGEEFIKANFDVVHEEQIPTRKNPKIVNPPLFYRYFCEIADTKLGEKMPDDYVVEKVLLINKKIDGVFVISSGKNMGAFKGVGEAHDIGDFFRLDEYKAHTWIAHSRFPTNTPGWWGGAHPFTTLNYSVVHNGEISSYGINKRCLESYGYECTMRTDTEVVAYAVDLLSRRHKLPWDVVAKVLASPFWKDVYQLTGEQKELAVRLRSVYSGLLLNGPFAFIIGFDGGFMALSDRVKLRPLVAGKKGKTLYVASEEGAIRLIAPDLDSIWHPKAGEPTFGFLEK